jgi:hypothetical protein
MLKRIILVIIVMGMFVGMIPEEIKAWPDYTHKKMIIQAIELLPNPYKQIMSEYIDVMQDGALQMEYLYYFYGWRVSRPAIEKYGSLEMETVKNIRELYTEIQEMRQKQEPIHRICYKLGEFLYIIQNLTRPPHFRRGGIEDAYTRDFHVGVERYSYMQDYVFDSQKVESIENIDAYLTRLMLEAQQIAEEYGSVYESNKTEYKGFEEIADKAYTQAIYSCASIMLTFFKEVED